MCPVIDHLSAHFADLYELHKVEVDEVMMKFISHSTLYYAELMKLTKQGIKVLVLGDSHNGYFQKFKVYTGKEESGETFQPEMCQKPLTKDLKGKYHVFFVNFFTSEQLMHDLVQDDIYACSLPVKITKAFLIWRLQS